MVRSIWQGALVVMLAYVGLAWSQSGRTGNSPAPSATMTVHENGKDVTCRVVTSWQQPNGGKAYQLQIISTGEMLTLVEDGPATTYQGKSGKMKALSMRIFHWGNRTTSPPGVPVPPDRVLSEDTGKPIVLSESNVELISLTPDPVLPPGYKICSPPTPLPGGNVACNTCQSGNCVSGPGSCCSGSGTVQNPGTGSFPYAQMPSGTKPGLGSPTKDVIGSETVQGTNPPLAQGQLPGKPVPGTGSYQKPGTNVVVQGPSAPAMGNCGSTMTRPPAAGTPDQGTIVQGTLPGQKTGTSSSGQIVTAPPQSTGTGNSGPSRPAPLAGQAASLGQTNTGAPSTLGTNQKATKPPHTLSEKIKHMFHPEQERAAGVAQNTSAGNTVAQNPSSPAKGTNQTNPTTLPPATATGTGKVLPPPLANTQPLNIPGTTTSGIPTTLPKVAPTTSQGTAAPSTAMSPTPPSTNAGPASSTQTAKDNKAAEKKSAWERIWGKPLFAKTKQPGQTTVDPTPAGTGPAMSGTKTQTSGAVVAQGPQAFPAPTTKAPAGTLVDVTPSAVPPLPPTASNLAPAGKVPALAQGKAMPPTSLTTSQNDPLLNPDQIKSSRLEAKVGGLPPTAPLAKTAPPIAGSARPATAGTLQNQLPPMPMGSGSVVASQNGLPIPYRYMPVPMVTVPNPLRNPSPPPPDVPVPPQPTAFVNAFSPGRVTPKPGEGPQNPNVAMGPFVPGPYGPLPDPRMMGYPPQMVAQGMYPYPGMNPYMMPQMGQPQFAYGQNMMPPMPLMTPLGAQHAIAQVNYPSNYQGPMPPNPMIGSNMPPMPYPPAIPMLPYGNLAMDRPGMPPSAPVGGNVTHLLGMLRDSISPAEREMAALNLNNQDWRSHPEIIQVLASSARQDPAATVRASCVRTLALQNINTEPVMTTLNGLKNDPDPRVRQEVDQALVRLNGSQAPVNTPALQPISYRP